MRREYLSRVRAMELQQKNVIQAHLENSQFAQKLIGLPMFKAAFDTAGGAYAKVKKSNALVERSIELAESFSSAVVNKLTPIAEKGINAASPLTTKVDAFAAASLEGLIARVPVITEEPKEIVGNTCTVINGYTESVLKAWPVQSAMDVYEVILKTACTTVDSMLPPTSEEKADQNCLAPTKESLGEEEKHKRGILLAQRTYLMFSNVFRRFFGICQTQVGNAAHATDIVYKQVRNAVSDTVTPTSTTDQNNVTNNGEANKPSSNKKAKAKKNPQEQ